MALPAEVVPQDFSAEHAYLVGLTLRACHLAKQAASHAADALGFPEPRRCTRRWMSAKKSWTGWTGNSIKG